MNFQGEAGAAFSRRLPKRAQRHGHEASKIAHTMGTAAAALESDFNDGGTMLKQLFPHVPDTKVTIHALLQVYIDSLPQNCAFQKKAALECQLKLWAMVEQNLWCNEVLLFFDHVLHMAKDRNWNFMAQQIVLLCSHHQLEAVCMKLSGHAGALALHECGCRLLCRICERGKDMTRALELLVELADGLSKYAMHRFGNFVVIKILENFVDFPGINNALLECVTRWQCLTTVVLNERVG